MTYAIDSLRLFIWFPHPSAFGALFWRDVTFFFLCLLQQLRVGAFAIAEGSSICFQVVQLVEHFAQSGMSSWYEACGCIMQHVYFLYLRIMNPLVKAWATSPVACWSWIFGRNYFPGNLGVLAATPQFYLLTPGALLKSLLHIGLCDWPFYRCGAVKVPLSWDFGVIHDLSRLCCECVVA